MSSKLILLISWLEMCLVYGISEIVGKYHVSRASRWAQRCLVTDHVSQS